MVLEQRDELRAADRVEDDGDSFPDDLQVEPERSALDKRRCWFGKNTIQHDALHLMFACNFVS